MNKITFYKPSDPYGEFSNFSEHTITIKGKFWPTVEHYFQAQKFCGSYFEEKIRNLPTPMDAKISGQDYKKPLRPDWERVKNDVMRLAVYQKFYQHKELKKLLLNTGDAYLTEHTKNDSYWADGGNGKGRNMLGQILMETRKKLKT
ncbi:MAG: NADAR family protein [Spongiibacteraceae bacterium]|nr:NADAR family protein [Spongiibacteraceae bacterium]